jgi:T5SS/PEP-CTERM-associated repeat protein
VSDTTGFIGNTNTSLSNSVLVTGAGSLWTNSGALIIGNGGAGNSLTINGGKVVATTITVSNNALLAGSGTLVGNTTITSGGSLTPGVSGTGVLTNAGTLTLSAGSTTTFNITATNSFSSINLAGNALTYGGALVFNINGYTPTAGNSFQLLTFGSQSATSSVITLAGTQSGSFVNTVGIWSLTNGSGVWQYTDSTGVLAILAVPEPSDIAFIAISGLALVIALRRRRVKAS